MTTGMNFWDTQVWSFIITLTLLFGAMMLANILRTLITPLRRLMIPSAVLGGFLLLAAQGLWKLCFHTAMFQTATLEMITYHGLGLGFVAMSLRNGEQAKSSEGKSGGFDAGVTVVATYLLQGILGLGITLLLSRFLNSFYASGLLLPMGYGQGPGQAYNWGRTYENTFGFTGGTSFGLTVAAMGFVAASIGGVVYLNVLRRQGLATGATGADVVDEHLSADMITAPGEIPLSESMDKFTVQLALVFLSYTLAYCFLLGINTLIEADLFGSFGHNTLQPLLWGFNFLFGTVFALLVKAVLKKLKQHGIIRREYTNNFLQTRISGFMFDLMVVASIAAIDLSAFTHHEFVVPLVIICLVGAAATYWYLHWLCPRVFPAYQHEAFLSLYGMLTGTASTGVILLREVDPKFQSQAAANLVYHQPWAIVFGFPIMLVMSLAPKGIPQTLLTLGILAVLFVILNLICLRHQSCFHRRKEGGNHRG